MITVYTREPRDVHGLFYDLTDTPFQRSNVAGYVLYTNQPHIV